MKNYLKNTYNHTAKHARSQASICFYRKGDFKWLRTAPIFPFDEGIITGTESRKERKVYLSAKLSSWSSSFFQFWTQRWLTISVFSPQDSHEKKKSDIIILIILVLENANNSLKSLHHIIYGQLKIKKKNIKLLKGI